MEGRTGRQMGGETGRQRDTTKLIVTFWNFWNANKN